MNQAGGAAGVGRGGRPLTWNRREDGDCRECLYSPGSRSWAARMSSSALACASLWANTCCSMRGGVPPGEVCRAFSNTPAYLHNSTIAVHEAFAETRRAPWVIPPRKESRKESLKRSCACGGVRLWHLRRSFQKIEISRCSGDRTSVMYATGGRSACAISGRVASSNEACRACRVRRCETSTCCTSRVQTPLPPSHQDRDHVSVQASYRNILVCSQERKRFRGPRGACIFGWVESHHAGIPVLLM